MIIVAAAAMCVSIYVHARAELTAALTKNAVAAEKLQDLTISVERVERDVQRLRTDPIYIEHVARQKFGFVRSGEVVIKVPESQNVSTSTSSKTGSVRAANLTVETRDGYTAASN
jgi:cell division protein FtsB